MSATHNDGILRLRQDDLLTVRDLAHHLGISKWTVYRFVRSGELPAVRVGESIRFRPEDVDAYLETRRVAAG
jgi:excisionase family DNA binding protein